jgi:hypothetical protein
MRPMYLIFIAVIALNPVISSAQELERVGSYPTTASSHVVVSANYAYIVDSNQFMILDISNRLSPTFQSSLVIPGRPGRFTVDGDLAFIVAGDSGLQIVDVANPSNPAILSSFPTPQQALDIKVAGSQAYLMDFGRLRILDVSNPVLPTELGNLNFYSYNEGIAFSGSYVYLIGWRTESDMLVSIDISNPANPHLIEYRIAGMFSSGLYLSGNNLYVLNEPAYFAIWDVSTPGHFGLSTRGMHISGITNIFTGFGYALASLGENGISIIDVSSSDSCFEVFHVNTPGYASDIFVAEDYVYVTDTDSLLIFRFVPSSVENRTAYPSEFSLSQNYPNPFNAQTTISYSLSQAGPVNLTIYNIMGQKVATLFDGVQTAGEYRVIWDAFDATSGIYFCQLSTSNRRDIRKLILLR